MRNRVMTALESSLLAASALAGCGDGTPTALADGAPGLEREGSGGEFTASFHLDRCTFAARGRNTFFVLEPGYTEVLEGPEDGQPTRLTIRVLDATEVVGGVATRVVEERQEMSGELVEISRNFFAICTQDNSVFYFGEETDIYEHGRIVSHEGSWRHGTNGARAGLIMPGIALLGARYFQELAPGVALDRAEIVGLDETVETSRRRFTGVLDARETTPLEPDVVDFKWYAPDVGLVRSNDLRLVRAGF
jgi:hypothetical protein